QALEDCHRRDASFGRGGKCSRGCGGNKSRIQITKTRQLGLPAFARRGRGAGQRFFPYGGEGFLWSLLFGEKPFAAGETQDGGWLGAEVGLSESSERIQRGAEDAAEAATRAARGEDFVLCAGVAVFLFLPYFHFVDAARD